MPSMVEGARGNGHKRPLHRSGRFPSPALKRGGGWVRAYPAKVSPPLTLSTCAVM